MSIERTLFSILRQELSENKEEHGVLDGIGDEELHRLLYLAKKHEISHIVAYACMNAGRLEQVEESKKIRKRVMSSFYQSEQKSYALSEIGGAFERIQIPYIPLKGSVIRDYYPEAWMRSSCDIDVLIKKEDSQKAIQSLIDIGYTLQQSETTHDYSLISPTGVHLELHYSLAQEGPFEKANEFLSNVWDYTVDSTDGSYRKKMTNEIFIFYHVAHMAKHFIRGGCGIRPFIDLWILKRKMDFNSEVLENLLREAKLLEFYHKVIEVANVWFENEPHTSTTLAVEHYVLMGGVYGTMSNVAVMSAAGGEGKIKWFLKLMFISREGLAIMYPKVERYPILYPFYQVKRWFRIFKKGKWGKIKKLTQARNSVTKDEATAKKELLNGLGLIEN